MSEHVIYNKTKLCFTEVSDFTDFQGIGSDPLYKRYDSVQAVLRTCIDEAYMGFLAQPLYNADEDTIDWYVEKWDEFPKRLVDLTGENKERYKRIMDDTVQKYRNAALKLENDDLIILGGAIKYVSEDMVFCYDNKVVMVAWGMCFDTKKHQDLGSLMHVIPNKPENPVLYQVVFNPGKAGSIEGKAAIILQADTVITADMVPAVKAFDDFRFIGWDENPEGYHVVEDKVFTAQYEKIIPEPPVPPVIPEKKEEPEPPLNHNVRFDAGEFGTLSGNSYFSVSDGSVVTSGMIPKVNANKGYKFTGWSSNPQNYRVTGDKVFTAQYEKKRNWFAAIWPWLWKLLLALLLLLLLIFILRNCKGCGAISGGIGSDVRDRDWVNEDPNTGHDGGIYDPGNPYTPVPTPPEYSDILPPQQGVLPPIGDDPIRQDPGQPAIIDNRLNVLMENEDKSIMDLARAFKNKYPGEQYQVVYYDDVVKRMQIKVPSEERVAMKERLPQEFAPEYKLFVFDESMFEGMYRPSDPEMSNTYKTWYLSAINAFDAWDITVGSDSVIVGVVDNGFNLNHEEFRGKVVMPYNVWTHDRNVFCQQEDHGSHVAGTAVAVANNGAGLCGIAPDCKLMPVQVADAMGRMTITSVLDGIVYALYQGADVINVSLGTSFMGLSLFPEDVQRELINAHFKEEQRLWEEVARIAESHKTTIVVAAGNDNILAGVEALQRPSSIIVVSALDKQNRTYGKADFSNYGEYSTISAPGVDIYSACRSGYEMMKGTSMACPVVTGSVALMKSINRNLTTQQIICVLQSTGKMVDGKVGPMLQLDKALQKVKNNDFSDCQPEMPKPSHGDVEITLYWNNYNDLDLYCVDPTRNVLSYKQRTSPSGGIYEIDMNNDETPGTNTPIEHIYWPTGGAPKGKYVVSVNFFARRDNSVDMSPFKVVVKYNGETKTYTGKVSSATRDCKVCDFTLE